MTNANSPPRFPRSLLLSSLLVCICVASACPVCFHVLIDCLFFSNILYIHKTYKFTKATGRHRHEYNISFALILLVTFSCDFLLFSSYVHPPSVRLWVWRRDTGAVGMVCIIDMTGCESWVVGTLGSTDGSADLLTQAMTRAWMVWMFVQ